MVSLLSPASLDKPASTSSYSYFSSYSSSIISCFQLPLSLSRVLGPVPSARRLFVCLFVFFFFYFYTRKGVSDGRGEVEGVMKERKRITWEMCMVTYYYLLLAAPFPPVPLFFSSILLSGPL